MNATKDGALLDCGVYFIFIFYERGVERGHREDCLKVSPLQSCLLYAADLLFRECCGLYTGTLKRSGRRGQSLERSGVMCSGGKYYFFIFFSSLMYLHVFMVPADLNHGFLASLPLSKLAHGLRNGLSVSCQG